MSVVRLSLANSAKAAAYRLTSPFRRFRRAKDGATAVEFGLIAVPFIGLIFAILETCLVFLTGQALETAVTDASRLIMTGQAQSGNFTQQQFKDRVCQRLTALVNCQAAVYLDVRTFSSFGSSSVPTPIDNNGNMITNNTQFTPGAAKQIVVVRAWVAYQVYTAVFGRSLANLPGNKRLIMATVAFRNEPYTN